jgi:hypothetical protein
MALEREFVAASERCEYERAVFRLKKTKYMLVTFGGGGVTFQGYVKKKKTSQRRDHEQQSSVKIKIKIASERREHELAVVLAEARRQFVDGQNVVHQPCRV